MVRQYGVIQRWSLAVVKANIILLCELGVRHILHHSPPPPLLGLQTDNTLSSPFHFPFIFSLKDIAPQTPLITEYCLVLLPVSITLGIIPLKNTVCSYRNFWFPAVITTARFTSLSRALCKRKDVLSTSSCGATSLDLSLQRWTVLEKRKKNPLHLREALSTTLS